MTKGNNAIGFALTHIVTNTPVIKKFYVIDCCDLKTDWPRQIKA
jgi:hypothetical protein